MRFILFLLLMTSFNGQIFAQKYLLKEDVNNDTLVPKFGYKRKYNVSGYFGLGFLMGSGQNNPPSDIYYGNSLNLRIGFEGRIKLSKWYALGFYSEFSKDGYRLKTPFYGDSSNLSQTVWSKQNNNNVVLGIFNRFNIKKDNVYLDMGAYYAYDLLPRIISKVKPDNSSFNTQKIIYNRPSIMNRSNYGLDAGITWGSINLYYRYRITGLYKNEDYDLPKMVLGIILKPMMN